MVEVLLNHLDYLNGECETEFLRHQLARVNQTYGKFDYQHCELWRKYLTLAQSSGTTVGYYRFLGTITEMAEVFDFGLNHYQDQADLLTEFIMTAEMIAQKDIFSLADSLWFQAQVKRLKKTLSRVRVELD